MNWKDRVEVHCNRSDVLKVKEGYMWVIEEANWNSQNQRGEVIMRIATNKDI